MSVCPVGYLHETQHKESHTMKHTLALISLIALVGCSSVKTVPVTYTWSEPQFGSPTKQYAVALRVNSQQWKTIGNTNKREYVVDCVIGGVNYVRVCAIDSLNRASDWSGISDAYIPTQTNIASTSQYIRITRD